MDGEAKALAMRRLGLLGISGIATTALACACAAPGGSASNLARPEVPGTRFGHPTDTVAYPLAHGDPGIVYYRTVAVVSFQEAATARQIRNLLEAFDGKIIAGTTTGDYVVQFPDPGPDPKGYRALLDALNRAPGVALAYPTVYSQDIRERDE